MLTQFGCYNQKSLGDSGAMNQKCRGSDQCSDQQKKEKDKNVTFTSLTEVFLPVKNIQL